MFIKELHTKRKRGQFTSSTFYLVSANTM